MFEQPIDNNHKDEIERNSSPVEAPSQRRERSAKPGQHRKQSAKKPQETKKEEREKVYFLVTSETSHENVAEADLAAAGARVVSDGNKLYEATLMKPKITF